MPVATGTGCVLLPTHPCMPQLHGYIRALQSTDDIRMLPTNFGATMR